MATGFHQTFAQRLFECRSVRSRIATDRNRWMIFFVSFAKDGAERMTDQLARFFRDLRIGLPTNVVGAKDMWIEHGNIFLQFTVIVSTSVPCVHFSRFIQWPICK